MAPLFKRNGPIFYKLRVVEWNKSRVYQDVCVYTSLSLFSSGVKRACCDFLESQLDPSNCLGIRDFAETHNCLDLMQAAELFSQKHFSEVVQHEEFMLLSQTEVEKLIKCDEIQVGKLDVMRFCTFCCYCHLYCRDSWNCIWWITKYVIWNSWYHIETSAPGYIFEQY